MPTHLLMLGWQSQKTGLILRAALPVSLSLSLPLPLVLFGVLARQNASPLAGTARA